MLCQIKRTALRTQEVAQGAIVTEQCSCSQVASMLAVSSPANVLHQLATWVVTVSPSLLGLCCVTVLYKQNMIKTQHISICA